MYLQIYVYEGLTSGAISRVDMHVVRSKVASPHPGPPLARAQIHDNRNEMARQLLMCALLAEGVFHAVPAGEDACHINVRPRGIEFPSGASCCRQDAAPVRIGARKH